MEKLPIKIDEIKVPMEWTLHTDDNMIPVTV
jgi:hypothetical protein